MLGWAKAIWKWSRPNDAVPEEHDYRYPAFTTWCAQKLGYFSPLFQSTQRKLVPLPTTNGLLLWGNYHAQNIITSRWKSRQELLSSSSVSSLPLVFTAVCNCVCYSRKHLGSMALSGKVPGALHKHRIRFQSYLDYLGDNVKINKVNWMMNATIVCAGKGSQIYKYRME